MSMASVGSRLKLLHRILKNGAGKLLTFLREKIDHGRNSRKFSMQTDLTVSANQ